MSRLDLRYRRSVMLSLFLVPVLVLASCGNPLDATRVVQASDAVAPTVSVTSPVEGDFYGEEVTVTGTVADSDEGDVLARVRSVTYAVTSAGLAVEPIAVELATDGTFTFSFVTAEYSSEIVVLVTAADWNGNEGSASVRLRYSGSDMPSFTVEPASSGVAVSFLPIEGADTYELLYTTNGAVPEDDGTALSVTLDQAYPPENPYQLVGLTNGKLHAFLLKATGSETVREWVSPVREAIPLAPLSLSPNAEADYGEVRLDWPDIPGAEGYRVLRASERDGTYVDISGPLAAASFTDTAPPADGGWYSVQPTNTTAVISAPVPVRPLTFGSLSDRQLERISMRAAEAAISYGDYVYLLLDRSGDSPGRIVVVDTSNAPEVSLVGDVSALNTLGYDDAFEYFGRYPVVHDGYLYAPMFSRGVGIIDLSTPTSPELVAIVDVDLEDHPTLGDIYACRSVVANGDYLYALFANHGVRAIDISSPESPVLLSRTPDVAESESTSNVDSLERNGNTLYMSVSSGKVILSLDLTNPASPVFEESAGIDSYAYDLQVVGDSLYVARWGEDKIDVFDATAALSGQTPTTFTIDGPRALALSGDFLLISGQLGLTMIDVSDPSSPVAFDTVEAQVSNVLATANGVAFVPSYSLGLQIVDVRPPVTLDAASVNVYDTGSFLGDFAVQQQFMYVGNRLEAEPAVTVHDVRGFPTVAKVGESSITGASWLVVPDGEYLYAHVEKDSEDSLSVFSIGDPTTPTLVGSIGLPAQPKSLVRFGQYLYVAMGTSGVLVADVSDPSAPTPAGFFAPSGDVESLDVAGGVLYLGLDAGNTVGLLTYDLRTNPAAPQKLGEVLDPAAYRLRTISYSGGYIFAEAGQSTGMAVFDVTSPSSPVFVTSVVSDIDGGGAEPSTSGLATSGDYAFLVDWPEESGPADAGIHVYRGSNVPDAPEEPAEYQVILLDDEYGGASDGEYFYAYLYNGEVRIYPLVQ